MAGKEAPPWLSAEAAAYVARHTKPADPLLEQLADRTRSETGKAAGMQVSAAQGSLLTLLTAAVGARRALEIGTFTGYSSICIARGLAKGGRLLCCDVSEDYTAIAREAWAKAGVADRIELRIAPALETLAQLPTDEPFDLAFIDADKESYPDYYENVLRLLRPGGLVMVDNTLWGGDVLGAVDPDSTTATIQAFNDQVANDERVDSFILPISDGLTLVRKH